MVKQKTTSDKGQLELRFGSQAPTPTSKPKTIPQPPAKKPERVEPSPFERRFHAVTRQDWAIKWTLNRSTMISYRRDDLLPVLRIHRMFADASPDIAEQIAKVVEGQRRSWPRVVNEYIQRHVADYAEQAGDPRRVQLSTKGEHVDLKPLFARLNAEYFDGEIDARLGWMTPRVQRRASIKLGSYSEQTHVIRMHPALDHPDVPLFVIESILFHEMVHAQVKSSMENGRRIVHGRAFKRELARYPDTEKADGWIRKNLGFLLPEPKSRTRRRKK